MSSQSLVERIAVEPHRPHVVADCVELIDAQVSRHVIGLPGLFWGKGIRVRGRAVRYVPAPAPIADHAGGQ
jgi:hypothetical protein